MIKPLRTGAMDLNLFVVFEAIYREQSITRASEQLSLSQPAVSHALRRLRGHLGDDLFERRGSLMRPTQFAEEIIGDVRAGIASLDHASSVVVSFDALSSTREFRISMPPLIEATLFPGLVHLVREAAPGIVLKSRRVKRRDLERALLGGVIDFGIDVHVLMGEGIQNHMVGKDELVVLVRPGHPLTYLALDQWTMAAYLDQQHLQVSTRSSGFGPEDYVLSKLGKRRKVAVYCQQYVAACEIVRQSDLLLTIPRRYVDYGHALGCEVLALPFKVSATEVYVYTKRSRAEEPAVCWLREQIVNASTR